MSNKAREVLAKHWLRIGGEDLDDCYPLHRNAAFDHADAIIAALKTAGLVPPMPTGVLHKALQDAYASGALEMAANKDRSFTEQKHKYCDEALRAMLGAME